MAGIYHPSRGGVRGGQDQFKWEDVKTDQDRENYLGHSMMVPVGRWQEGKDLMWYTRDKKNKDVEKLTSAEEKRRDELRRVKDLEARAMSAALGHKSFSVGTTSLTAKELQEVLSRGKIEHEEGEKIQGMGYKKSIGEKQAKYGTEFEGKDDSQRTNQDTEDPIKKSSKKKKKKEKKEKKKKKKKRHSDDEDLTLNKQRSGRYDSKEYFNRYDHERSADRKEIRSDRQCENDRQDSRSRRNDITENHRDAEKYNSNRYGRRNSSDRTDKRVSGRISHTNRSRSRSPHGKTSHSIRSKSRSPHSRGNYSRRHVEKRNHRRHDSSDTD